MANDVPTVTLTQRDFDAIDTVPSSEVGNASVLDEVYVEITGKKASKLATVAKYGGRALTVAKWAWSIPFIKSMIGTRLTQLGIVGAVALAVGEKVLG